MQEKCMYILSVEHILCKQNNKKRPKANSEITSRKILEKQNIFIFNIIYQATVCPKKYKPKPYNVYPFKPMLSKSQTNPYTFEYEYTYTSMYTYKYKARKT